MTNIRLLKDLRPPVEIYFEKERLYSLDDKTDMVLGLMSSIAQEESRSISANIRWAIKNRMKDGTQKIPTSALLGYDTDEDGNMVIVQSEAEIVKTIYRSFVSGVHPSLIATRLNGLSLTTVYGNPWNSSSIRNILRNEKYCGDVLMQKTITVDYLTHRTKRNEGEEAQYYIPDHYDPIVDRDMWNKAQEILDKTSWKRWKKRTQQRLLPLRSGLLLGFVSISPEWKDVSITRLESATRKLMENQPSIEAAAEAVITESEEIIMAESNGIDAGLAFGKLNIADMPETDMDFFSKVILGNAFHGAEVVDPLAKSFIIDGHNYLSFFCPHKTYQYYPILLHIATGKWGYLAPILKSILCYCKPMECI